MQHYGERNTVCHFESVGCAYACAFCSTGQGRFTRHLTPTEIFDQARYFARHLRRRPQRSPTWCFMGMGEPFHNYRGRDGRRAIAQRCRHGLGWGIGTSTISTVGIVPQIDQFAEEAFKSISRSRCTRRPTTCARRSCGQHKWNVGQLMERRRTLHREDEPQGVLRVRHARRREPIARRCRGARASDARLAVSRKLSFLTTARPTPSSPNRRPAPPPFSAILEAKGIACTVRIPMGRDIAAASGNSAPKPNPAPTRADA